ncbi:MAG: DUF2804 family protein [Treponemataceae bacterium]
MYLRELSKSPETLIKNGKSLFGSYDTPPKSIKISGVYRPYGIFPLPTWITNLGIRSTCSFVFNTEEFLGTIDMLNIRIIGLLEVNIWNKSTNQRFSYRGITGIHRHLIPKNLDKGICFIHNKKRYIRFAWDKKKNRFSLVFHMKGDNVRPNFDGSFIASYNCKNPTLTSVLPAPTTRRCYVSHQRLIKSTGGVFTSKQNENPFFLPQKVTCLFTSARAYYKFRILSNLITGIGNIKENSVVFRLTNFDCFSENTDKYNENSLFVNNELTALPPVMITHPYGLSKKWIIQDTEGMIDLTFTPSSTRQKFLSLVILNIHYNFIFGKFDGVIVSKSGESFTLKDFTGIIKNLRLRI